MKTRDAVICYQETEKDTATAVKDLDLVEPISAIDLEVECTNGATSNKGNYISDIVTKVEIVDGSEVLYGLNMSQLEAMQFYKTGKLPTMFPSEWGGGVQRHKAKILFGRYLWDRDYNFDATRCTNPQLKVTFNKAVIRAAAGDGFAIGDNILLTVVAKVFKDVPAAGKFLLQKQIENFTSVGSGEKRVDLPTDYVYRMLLLRFWLQGKDIDEIMSDAKLTCDTDAFIPFNRKVKQLDAEALEKFGASRLKHDIFCSHQETVRLLHNKEPDMRPFYQSNTIPDIVGIDYQWSSEMKLNMFDHAGAADTTDRKLTMVEEGHALHATLPVTFGRYDVPEDWFDPTVYKKLELVLTQLYAGAVCEIACEQVKTQ